MLNLLPDLESQSLMHDIYCQRQSITDADGNRLLGTAPCDFDLPVALHHAYAAETLSASRARAVLVCGSHARKFFESAYNVPRNAVQGHIISVDSIERELFFILHPKYLASWAPRTELVQAAKTLRTFASKTDQPVNLDGFVERKNDKGLAPASGHNRLPSSDEVKACREHLCSGWSPSTEAGRDARAGQSQPRESSGFTTTSNFHFSTTPASRGLCRNLESQGPR